MPNVFRIKIARNHLKSPTFAACHSDEPFQNSVQIKTKTIPIRKFGDKFVVINGLNIYLNYLIWGYYTPMGEFGEYKKGGPELGPADGL